MIHGVGTDIVEIARMQRALDRHGERFAQRILTDNEWLDYQQCSRPAAFLARRFAAKEAVVKAFGTGFRSGLSLRHIGVGHDAIGRPCVELRARARELADSLGAGECHLSLSDEAAYAVAFVVAQRRHG